MRKIHISNEAKRDAEVAFGTTFRRTTPVYKTASGSTGKNERRLKATMATTMGPGIPLDTATLA